MAIWWPRSDGDIAAGRRFLREARGFERGLYIHSVIDNIRDKLRMRQRLIRSAHDAETDMHVAALHVGGDDGMKRPLASREHVGRLRVEPNSE